MSPHGDPAASVLGSIPAVRTTAPVRTAGGQGAKGYVPEIDALRCIAMVGVILFHSKIMPFGWMGVWLFYVISGFAVTSSIFGSRHANRPFGETVRHFWVRRALRIWPLYYGYLAVNVAAILALGLYGTLQEVPWLVTFTFNIHMMFETFTPENQWGLFAHLWTLATEQQFYLFFPLILLLRGRAQRAMGLAAAIAIAPTIRFALGQWLTASGYDAERTALAIYVFAPAHFDAFSMGALIALFRAEIARDRRITAAVAAVAAVVTVYHVGVYGTLGILRQGHFSFEALRNIVSGIEYGDGREITVYFVPTLIGAALICGMLSGKALLLRFGRLPWLQAIGRVSYGGYVLHSFVLMMLLNSVPFFGRPVGTPAGLIGHIGLAVCAIPITVGLAWLSFTYFERRFLNLGRRYA